jgi:poly(A) polymerase
MGRGSRQLAQRVAMALVSRGYPTYFVGGCVRDSLLRRPAGDFDLATAATPDIVKGIFPEAQDVGAHFGVVLVREGESEVQVATFRSDHAYRDGRHPETVTFKADVREDVVRRDFTINALLEDPATGEILDFTGGRADLAAGVIRAIEDPMRRFEEDHLRMLRAVRFAARFNFTIEDRTIEAIRRQAASISHISAERIRDELSRILTEGGARRGFELLDESGLLKEILPEVSAMKGIAQPPEYHPEGDVWTHTLLLLQNLRAPTVTLALGALLHDVGKPPTFRIADRIRFDGHADKGAEMAEEILRRMRYSRADADAVVALVRMHLRFIDIRKMKKSTLVRFLRTPQFEEHLELHRLDCISSHGNLDHYDYAREKWESISTEELRPEPLLTGDDLIAMGYHPGPKFAEILHAVEDAQLDGSLSDGDAAREWVRQHYARP